MTTKFQTAHTFTLAYMVSKYHYGEIKLAKKLLKLRVAILSNTSKFILLRMQASAVGFKEEVIRGQN